MFLHTKVLTSSYKFDLSDYRVGSDNLVAETSTNGSGRLAHTENGNGHVEETERGVNFCNF